MSACHNNDKIVVKRIIEKTTDISTEEDEGMLITKKSAVFVYAKGKKVPPLVLDQDQRQVYDLSSDIDKIKKYATQAHLEIFEFGNTKKIEYRLNNVIQTFSVDGDENVTRIFYYTPEKGFEKVKGASDFEGKLKS